MISESDSFNSDKVIRNLNTKIIGRNLFHFKAIDSTNLYTKKLVNQSIEEGAVVVADVQLKGRGRKNRTWSSPEGGLWFSILLYPNIPPQSGMLITMISSVAVTQVIEDITGLKPEIKWPNDLLLNGKKVCGILTELEAKMDKIDYVVVGIGINVNNQLNPELLGTATTLKLETNTLISREKLLKSILTNFDKNYNRLISGDYNFVRDSWLVHSNIIGKKIQVEDDKILNEGIVTDVNDCGHLILETEKGQVKIVSGDIIYL